MKHINKRELHNSIKAINGRWVFPRGLHPNDADKRTFVPISKEQWKLQSLTK